MRIDKVFRSSITAIGVILFAAVVATMAQQGPVRGSVETIRDKELELAAMHNLTTAKYYMDQRKGYVGALDRLQEIVDTDPQFSRMDEVVFLMGEANLKLKKAPLAIKWYQRTIKDFPESTFSKKARARLTELKAPVDAPDPAKPAPSPAPADHSNDRL